MEKIDINQIEMNPFNSIGQDDFLLSAGDEKGWNTMTAGWGGMGYMWGKPCFFVFVRESRYTLSFMDKYDSFSVSFFPPEKKSILSYCGSHSGRDTDKAKGAGLTPVFLDGTVVFEEANLSFTLKKLSKHFIEQEGFISPEIKERWYKNGDYHYMFVGEIKNAYVEDSDITVVENAFV